MAPRQRAVVADEVAKTTKRKRKSNLLDTELDTKRTSDNNQTSDADEGIALMAKRLATNSQSRQQQLRKDQWIKFLQAMKKVEDEIPDLLENQKRNRSIHDKLLQLRALLLRRGELDEALVQKILDLEKLMAGAQRSLTTVVQMRKDELQDLEKMLQGDMRV